MDIKAKLIRTVEVTFTLSDEDASQLLKLINIARSTINDTNNPLDRFGFDLGSAIVKAMAEGE